VSGWRFRDVYNEADELLEQQNSMNTLQTPKYLLPEKSRKSPTSREQKDNI